MASSELPLNPQKPLPPPRRFEITLDGKRHAVMIAPTRGPAPPPKVLWVPGKYEINGDCRGDDESREISHDAGTDALIVDSLYGIHRPGEDIGAGMADRPFSTHVGQQVPSYPSGNVISRERLHYLASTGRLKKPDNMVNSFRPGRLRRRRKPFPFDQQMEAAALVNPGAYHGIAMSARPLSMNGAVLARGVAMGYIVIAGDGTVYHHTRDESGASIFKKIGKVTKKVGKGIAKGAKATGKGIAKGAKFVGKGMAILAAAPIKAMLKPYARKRARLIARSKGYDKPTYQDRREGGAWVVQMMKKNRNPLVKAAALLVRAAGGVMGHMAVVGQAEAAAVPSMLAAIQASLIPILTTALATALTTAATKALIPGKSPAPPGQMPTSDPSQYQTQVPAPAATEDQSAPPQSAEQPAEQYAEQPTEQPTSSEGWSLISFRPYP